MGTIIALETRDARFPTSCQRRYVAPTGSGTSARMNEASVGVRSIPDGNVWQSGEAALFTYPLNGVLA